MSCKAVIFDLDGVIVSTDEYHYQAWQRMSDEEGINFDSELNEQLRGVSRMESLGLILNRAQKVYTGEEKAGLAHRKNEYYRELLNKLTPDDILPGAMTVLEELKRRGIKVAIGSSSQNTPFILKKIGLADYFDAIADGNEIVNSKPHPEVFLLAASKLEIRAEDCVVIEDAAAGIDAALAAGMIAVGVASASTYASAQYKVKDLLNFNIDELINDMEVI